MKCLDCNQEMMNYEVHTLTHKLAYDLCESCGGLWLDRNELEKMAFKVKGSIEFCSEDEVKGISKAAKNCPRCKGLHLYKVTFIDDSTGIILDHCKNCGGFWVDGGELEKLDKELTKLMPVSGKGFSEFLTNVHLPFWYKRIKRDSKDTDFSVPVLPVKHAKLQGSTGDKCPACKGNLNLLKVYGIQIEGCPECNGIWLEKGELKALKAKVDTVDWGNLRWMDDEIDAIEKISAAASDRLCPKCNGRNLLSTYFGKSKTMIDWCKNCHGVWLDKDEFEIIVQYLKEELNHLTSKEMEKKAVEEVKKIWEQPGNKISEILDAKAAISALVNIMIFEHANLAARLLAIPRI